MAVTFVAIRGKGISQLLYHHRSLLVHASTSRENKRCEGSVLDFPYPLSVLSFLITLHLPKQTLEGLGPVASRVWVKKASVKECVTALGPEPPHPDICSGIWVSVGGAVPERFSHQGLQLQLNFNINSFMHDARKSVGSLWRM